MFDGLGNVTFVNGILRIQTLAVDPAGNVSETGNIETPGNKIGEVINLLATAAQGINDKIEATSEIEKEEGKDKKPSKEKKKKK
jgi:hypothetical protein